MRYATLTTGLLVASALGGVEPVAAGALGAHRPLHKPYIEVWTSRELFRRGDRVHVWFRSETDAHVTIFRVDTDGRVHVLYPYRPWHNNFVPGGRRLGVWVPGDLNGNHAFLVDDHPGQGYIFAVASLQPFDYGALVRGDHWDSRSIAHQGRITGDPYHALTDLIDRIVPISYDGVSYDIYPYYVERRYEYPRFLCYDCHTYVAYSTWDPYRYSCVRFRIVIYDDPYYYPARVYPGTRVIYARPRQIRPRYVFRERVPTDRYVTKVRRRSTNSPRRRVSDGGATSRDVGGVGSIPAPSRRPSKIGDPRDRRTTEVRQRSVDVRVPTARPEMRRRPTVRPDSLNRRVQPKLERRSRPSPDGTTQRRRQVQPQKAKPDTQPARRRRPIPPHTPDGTTELR